MHDTYHLSDIGTKIEMSNAYVLMHRYESGRLVVPDCLSGDGRDGWGLLRRSRFIESAMLGLPLGICYFVEDLQGRWLALDGCHRLHTLFDFLSKGGGFALSRLQLLTSYNGCRFGDLPSHLQYKIENSLLHLCVISATTSAEAAALILQRANLQTASIAAKRAKVQIEAFRNEYLP